MTETRTLSGKDLAADIRSQVAADVKALREHGVEPTLAIVFATSDGGTRWYVSSIVKAAEKAGLRAIERQLPDDSTTADIAAELQRLANDDTVHGIILQTPLPVGVDGGALAALIPFGKDIDGINPLSAGRLVIGESGFAPATAAAVMELLRFHQVPLVGRHAVVVGRSAVVGKPVAQLLLREDATVTVCHSKTADLPEVTREADVLVVAIGRARFITGRHVGAATTVIDVGTNTDDAGNLVGDVDAGSVVGVAAALTPVPGGVGPVTTALLLQHVIAAARAVG
ncbi:bifunctional 5,10-methylenetetrahydrofolate dehydrogenase/5,10-methenyltetrahydrofolate cyclohydrolase [Actinophytocola glycyrrhizae]|uniref:Bifunctional protein FolD n=1 Tax=Actinophytocola glycyrrhizae TaxID=2044873 RepID=A0ABV9SFQ5_9PSEU